jgi:NAD(P)-dependent dehydrogenase (short-subunit alcohol dehydrogenase family)
MVDRLRGKVAVVTGAGSGIGLSTARRLHAEGAKVVLTDISGAENEAAAELGEGAIALNASVTNPDDAVTAMETGVREFGGIDILVNVAGAVLPQRMIVDVPLSDFDKMVDINLRGVFIMVKAVLPHLLERGGGSIVNIASGSALVGMPTRASYSAAKAGVLGLSRSVAMEYAKQGVRVNSIAPGAIRTPLLEARLKLTPDALAQAESLMPMGRLGTAEEIADTVVFLASDEASYITGIVLPVDGGQTAGR